MHREQADCYDIVIIGAGTAGLSAAIYGVRAGKKVLVLEEASYGGQIIVTPEIENYPGMDKVSGYEFAQRLYEQAVRLGAEIRFEQATSITLQDSLKFVKTAKNEYGTKSIILATGAKNRALGLAEEKKWTGRGVSYCATCDGAFFKGKDVAVVGGGNTALEDALFLSGYCKHVYLIHRRNTFRGEKQLLLALKEKDNVTLLLEKIVTELKGENRLNSITLEDVNQGKKSMLNIDGLFVAIGQAPDNERFAQLVDLDEKGYIIAGEECKTSREGIFAAGDCRTKEIRQLVTAAADGAIAALAACQCTTPLQK